MVWINIICVKKCNEWFNKDLVKYAYMLENEFSKFILGS